MTYKDAVCKLQLDCGYRQILCLQNKMKTDSTFLGWSFHYLFIFLSFFPSAFCTCALLCVMCSYNLLSLGMTENIFILIFVDYSATDMDGDEGS